MTIPPTSADQIEVFQRVSYEDRIHLKAQQKMTKLWGWGNPMPLRAKVDYFDRYDDVAPREILRGSGRLQPTPFDETPRRRRQIVARAWEYHEEYDFIWDELETMRARLDDDAFQTNVVAGFQRQRDIVWDEAVDGLATEVNFDNDPPTTLTLAFGEATPGVAIVPGGVAAYTNNTVPVAQANPDGSTLLTGMTMGKAVALDSILNLNDVEEGDRVLVMHGIQKEQLLNDIKATNADFGKMRLEDSVIGATLGFATTVVSNRLALVTGIDGGTDDGHYAYGMHRRAVRTGQFRGFTVFPSVNPEQRHRFLVSHYDWFAATRAFEEDVSRAECEDVAALL